jgi:isoquinoline 1-oxidoreductase subunit alpha
MTIAVNRHEHVLHGVDPDMPLLWAVRDLLGLKGISYAFRQAAYRPS